MDTHSVLIRRRLGVGLAILLLVGLGWGNPPLVGQEMCKAKFSKLKLSDQDKAVFEHLNRLSEDRNEFLKSVTILLAVAEVTSSPKTVTDLAEELAKSEFDPIDDKQFSSAAKGVVQISAKPTYEALTLFIAGKANYVDKKFEGYKPKGEVLRLLTCLQKRYQELAATGK